MRESDYRRTGDGMKKLFDIIPEELFSVLASPNKRLYADALMVLYTAYQEKLKITVNDLYSMLRSTLEAQLLDADFSEEGIELEEAKDISGKARFLIRKLAAKGWLEKERGEDFTEYIIIPDYSSKLLQLLYGFSEEKLARGASYVFSTYSGLKVAAENKNINDLMLAVYSAYDNTLQLRDLLKSVYHNIRRFCQLQAALYDVNDVLATHFDDFGQNIIEKYIRPLKIKDSVPKYRNAIEEYLDNCLEDERLELLAQAAFKDKRAADAYACRADLQRKILWIKDMYESLEVEYLEEIDKQVRRYTRATTQKLENLLNRDQNVRANIDCLLQALAQKKQSGALVEKLQPAFSLFSQNYLAEKSLWKTKRIVKRERVAPVVLEEEPVDEAMQLEAAKMFSSAYSQAAVNAFVQGLLDKQPVIYTEDWPLADDYGYIMHLMTLVKYDAQKSPYKIDALEGEFTADGYSLPQLCFSRKEAK